ncbi:boron transporter 2 [Tripterygium wilfordii]|uniref:Boron transporter 2 n=1 Tax=Tripterygium wilfordii TaxID=458696 RepID=A0A7J7DBJ4_TRIWF|nr:boron transporter 2 [Tripterygium wilfordii]
MQKNSNLGQLYRSMQQAYNEMQTPLVYQMPSALELNSESRSSNAVDAEIFDAIITRSRGEIHSSRSPKLTSSAPASYSPELSQRVYSPRINERRVDRSPQFGGNGNDNEIKPALCPGPSSNLGHGTHGSCF